MVEVKCEIPKKNCWPQGHKYGCQCKCKQGSDEKRLRYVQPPRMPSFAPVKAYKAPEVKMADNSTYRLSFEAFDQKMLRACRGTPSKTKENLVTAGAFSGYTTNRMSYGSWIGIQKEKLIYPKDHKLTGEGPIASITTNRHDYQPKTIDTTPNIVQTPNLGFSTSKMESNTTNILSYQCPDYRTYEPPLSYKPQTRYLPPASPIDGNTIHKLSFLPWVPTAKEEPPWGKKCPYVSPKIPLDGTTIYNGSYIAPGSVVEDEEGHCQGCYCLYPGECMGQANAKSCCPEGCNPNGDQSRPPPNICP